jgi:hypothetical protein
MNVGVKNAMNWHIGTMEEMLSSIEATGEHFTSAEKLLPPSKEVEKSIIKAVLGKYEGMRLMSSMLAETLAYVYICVLPQHLRLAQWYVSYWKESPPVRFASMFVRYRVITVATEGDDGGRMNLHAVPPLRSCWREVRRLTWAETGEYDLVVVLRGIAAMSSFIPPCVHEQNDLPACQAVEFNKSIVDHNGRIGFAPVADETAKTKRLFCPIASIIVGATVSEKLRASNPVSHGNMNVMMIFSGIFHQIANLVLLHAPHYAIVPETSMAFDERVRATLLGIIKEFPTMLQVDSKQLNFASIDALRLLHDMSASLSVYPDQQAASDDDLRAMCQEIASVHFALKEYCVVILAFALGTDSRRHLLSSEGTVVSQGSDHLALRWREDAKDLFLPPWSQRRLFAERMLLFHKHEEMQLLLFSTATTTTTRREESIHSVEADLRDLSLKSLMLLHSYVGEAFMDDEDDDDDDKMMKMSESPVHPWMRWCFQDQNLLAWIALQRLLSPASPACPVANATDYLHGVHDAVYALGHWYWHTWALVQTVRRMWYFLDVAVCSVSDVRGIIHMVAKSLLQVNYDSMAEDDMNLCHRLRCISTVWFPPFTHICDGSIVENSSEYEAVR